MAVYKILSRKETDDIQGRFKQGVNYPIPLLTDNGLKVVYPFMMDPLAYTNAIFPKEGVLTGNKTVLCGVVVQKICGVWTTMSLHMTWINAKVDSVITQNEIDEMGKDVMREETGMPQMGRRSQVLISHGTPDNLPAVIKDVTAVTKRVLTAKSKPEVVNLVAEAQFKLFQQTPWARGGGNIPENLGAILFGLRKIQQLRFADDTNLFFESHAHPFLSQFVKKFPKFIVFDPATTLELEKEAGASKKDKKKKSDAKEGKAAEKS